MMGKPEYFQGFQAANPSLRQTFASPCLCGSFSSCLGQKRQRLLCSALFAGFGPIEVFVLQFNADSAVVATIFQNAQQVRPRRVAFSGDRVSPVMSAKSVGGGKCSGLEITELVEAFGQK